ncbi:MAG: hypothetical protein AAF791_14600 [Bacteroidota bacterium]
MSLSPLALLAVVLLAAACSGPSPAMDKMDAPLRARLAAAAETDTLDVLLDIAPGTDAEAPLRDAGLEVRSVAGTVVVVAGSPAALRRAAAFDWVRRMELSRERSRVSAP